MGLLDRAVPFADLDQDWEPEWIVEPFLFRHGITVLHGAPKQRKSTFRAHLIACCATGTPVCGRWKIQRPARRILVCLGEESGAADATRLRRDLRGLGVADARHPVVDLVSPPAFRLGSPDGSTDAAVFIHDTASAGYDLVVIDPLIAFHAHEENSAEGMQQVMAVLREVAKTSTVLIVHHAGKHKDGDPADRLRGSSAIRGAYDVGIAMTREGENPDHHRLHLEFRYSAPMPHTMIRYEHHAVEQWVRWHSMDSERMDEEILRELFRTSVSEWTLLGLVAKTQRTPDGLRAALNDLTEHRWLECNRSARGDTTWRRSDPHGDAYVSDDPTSKIISPGGGSPF